MAIKATVRDTTQEALETAEEKLGVFADKAYEVGKATAKEAVVEQRNAFKRFCKTIVRALLRSSEELRDEGYATVAGVVEDVANKADDMTDEIDDLDLRSATDRVEAFVRERPMVAYGALALAGFLVANTLQAASARQHAAPARVTAKPTPRRVSKTSKVSPARPKAASKRKSA